MSRALWRVFRSTVIFQALQPLYLASSSPRRIDFFRQIGLETIILAPDDRAEARPFSGESPSGYALRAARGKLRAALALLPAPFSPTLPRPLGAPACCAAEEHCLHESGTPVIIAADTVVALEGRIFGKPRDESHAFVVLSALAGRAHDVFTGCVLVMLPEPGRPSHQPCESVSPVRPLPKPQVLSFFVKSQVHMWQCPSNLLRAYSQSGEPLDKAGGYAVQGAGAFLVKSIEGSWSNVVGLPMAEVIKALLRLDAIAPLVWTLP